jgi:hypothetical protein
MWIYREKAKVFSGCVFAFEDVLLQLHVLKRQEKFSVLAMCCCSRVFAVRPILAPAWIPRVLQLACLSDISDNIG